MKYLSLTGLQQYHSKINASFAKIDGSNMEVSDIIDLFRRGADGEFYTGGNNIYKDTASRDSGNAFATIDEVQSLIDGGGVDLSSYQKLLNSDMQEVNIVSTSMDHNAALNWLLIYLYDGTMSLYRYNGTNWISENPGPQTIYKFGSQLYIKGSGGSNYLTQIQVPPTAEEVWDVLPFSATILEVQEYNDVPQAIATGSLPIYEDSAFGDPAYKYQTKEEVEALIDTTMIAITNSEINSLFS